MTSHTLPSVYALHIVEFVQRWQVPESRILMGLDTTVATLREPHGRVPLDLVLKVLERARTLSGEPALGFYLGLHTRVSLHGFLGFASMSAPNVRESIGLTSEFMAMVTSALTVRLRVDDGFASMILEEHADFGADRDTVLLSLLVGWWKIGEAMTGRELDNRIDLMIPEPPYADRLRELLPRVRFNQPNNRLYFDAAHLDYPHTLADSVSLQLAREQCERALVEVGALRQVSGRVRSLVAKTTESSFPSLEDVAASVGVSSRTLKRRLAAEGMSFSELLDEERRERAFALLRTFDLSTAEIAQRLGYSNAANFARAFQRWTGSSPSRYRRTLSVRA